MPLPPMPAPQDPPAIVRSNDLQGRSAEQPTAGTDLGAHKTILDAFSLTGKPLIEKHGVEKMLATVETTARQEITSFVSGLNQKLDSGTYVASDTLYYKVPAKNDVSLAVSAALGISPELLTAEHLSETLKLNKANSQVSAALKSYLDSIENGVPSEAKLPEGALLKVRSPEALHYEAMLEKLQYKLYLTLELASQSTDIGLTAEGKKNLAQLRQVSRDVSARTESQALFLETNRSLQELGILAQRGLPIRLEENFSPSVQKLETLASDETISLMHRERIASELARAKQLEGNRKFEIALVACGSAEASRDPTKAAAYLLSAKNIVGLLPEDKKLYAQARIDERADSIVPPAIGELFEKKTADAETKAREWARVFSTSAQIEEALGRGQLFAASAHNQKQSSLSEDDVSKAFRAKAAGHFERALHELGIRPATGDFPQALDAVERPLAERALACLLETRVQDRERHEVERLRVLTLKLVALDQSEEARLRETSKLKARIAVGLFSRPSAFEEETKAFLGIAGLSLSEARQKLLSGVEERVISLEGQAPELKAKKSYRDERAVLEQCRREMLVEGIISGTTPEEKRGYYARFSAINQRMFTIHEAAIAEGAKVLKELETASIDAQSQSEISARRAHLEKMIQANQRVLAKIIGGQFVVALAGDDAELRRDAKRLLGRLEDLAPKDQLIQGLVTHLKSSHDRGSAEAGYAQFVSESNRDFPPYTLGLMIAAGALGALLGSRLTKDDKVKAHMRGLGFVIASCTTLGAVKCYYTAAGADQMHAAIETGLSTYERPQTGLNTAYLAMDLLQVGAGYVFLRRYLKARDRDEGRLPLEAGQSSLLSEIPKELRASFQELLRAFNPTTLSGAVLCSALLYGGFKLATAGVSSSQKGDLAADMGMEVGATLAVAIMLGRIDARLRGRAEKSEDKNAAPPSVDTMVQALNGTPDSPRPSDQGSSGTV